MCEDTKDRLYYKTLTATSMTRRPHKDAGSGPPAWSRNYRGNMREKRSAGARTVHQKLPRTNAVVFFRRRTLRSVNEKLQTGPNPAWGSPSSLEECWAHSSVSQTRDRSGPAQLALLLIRF